jgi:Flp pilus assembly protein TadB
MANRFLLALLMLLPGLAYGYYLLNRELNILRDPFLDAWLIEWNKSRKQITTTLNGRNKSWGASYAFNPSSQPISYNYLQPLLITANLGLLVLLILFQAPIISIASLAVTLVTYLWWEKTSEHRNKIETRKNIERELPVLAEVFSILISAGVSPSSAFEWVGSRAHGALGDRVRRIVTDCREGQLLVTALDKASNEIASPIVRRFVDSIAISVDRGSSLAEQLRLYVGEMRVHEQRKLMERAGKAEIGLMIPVVFLILPISVVFALWPSYQSLSGFLLH